MSTPASTTIPPARPESSAKGDSRSLMRDRAYVELKGLIQDSTFPPGEFLSERQLAARLGMSKTPVKAALERLSVEGFVSVSPQQGIVVRDVSILEVADHFEIRAALETFVLRSIAGKLSAAKADQLRRNLDEHREAAQSSDVAKCVGLDAEFHLLLCQFHGNQEVMKVMLQLREKMYRVILRVFCENVSRMLKCAAEHAAIADAVLSGDADLAARLVERHLTYGKQFLLTPRQN